MMEHPSKLEENLDALLTKFNHLKYSRGDFKIRGEHQKDRWLNDLEDKGREVDEIQKALYELKSGFHPNKFYTRLNLNKKVIKTLKALEVLEQEGDEDSKSIQMFITEQKKGTPQQYSCEQLIGFTSNSRIGYGGFADVYKGEINGVLVAIKVLRDSAGHVMKRQFMAEVSLMFTTSHRNLVKLHGYCYDTKFKALVYEYMEHGSLDKILYNNQHSIQWDKLYDIAIQTAKGISYLHDSCSVPIIHHDIKAANVLLDSNFSPKVTDFGMAKIYKSDKNHVTQSQIGGTRVYAAPEVRLGSHIVTYYCDIFSFGMMLFEVLQKNMIREGEDWFPGKVWQNFEKGRLENIISESGIEEKNKEKAHKLAIAALWCTQYKPQDRPAMSTVINVLEGIIQLQPPPNPFPYNVLSIPSNTSDVSTRTGGPPHPLASSVVSPPSGKRVVLRRRKKRKLEPSFAATMIQRKFRVYRRRRLIPRALRNLVVAKNKLKDLRDSCNNLAYHIQSWRPDTRELSKRILVQILLVESIEVDDGMVRATKKLILDELEKLQKVVDPTDAGKLREIDAEIQQLINIEKKNGSKILRGKSKGENKELSPHDAAKTIQMRFREFIITRRHAVHSFREYDAAKTIQMRFREFLIRRHEAVVSFRKLMVVKKKLKEAKSMFNDSSYRSRMDIDADLRRGFVEEIIILLTTTDYIQVDDVMVRSAKRLILHELEVILNVMEPVEFSLRETSIR